MKEAGLPVAERGAGYCRRAQVLGMTSGASSLRRSGQFCGRRQRILLVETRRPSVVMIDVDPSYGSPPTPSILFDPHRDDVGRVKRQDY